MNDVDYALGTRLAALEASVPSPGRPASLGGPTHRPRLRLSLASGAVLALAVGASALASVAVVSNLVRGYPGIENPGQPLAGANLECMTPPQAAAYLAAHGYIDVVWEVNEPNGNDIQQAAPPDHGYVVPGAVVGDGHLHIVIDQRPGVGVGACAGRPMP